MFQWYMYTVTLYSPSLNYTQDKNVSGSLFFQLFVVKKKKKCKSHFMQLFIADSTTFLEKIKIKKIPQKVEKKHPQ